ncbi:hypothetical protein [Nonomuraea sp. 10N515B]
MRREQVMRGGNERKSQRPGVGAGAQPSLFLLGGEVKAYMHTSGRRRP